MNIARFHRNEQLHDAATCRTRRWCAPSFGTAKPIHNHVIIICTCSHIARVRADGPGGSSDAFLHMHAAAGVEVAERRCTASEQIA